MCGPKKQYRGKVHDPSVTLDGCRAAGEANSVHVTTNDAIVAHSKGQGEAFLHK